MILFGMRHGWAGVKGLLTIKRGKEASKELKIGEKGDL